MYDLFFIYNEDIIGGGEQSGWSEDRSGRGAYLRAYTTTARPVRAGAVRAARITASHPVGTASRTGALARAAPLILAHTHAYARAHRRQIFYLETRVGRAPARVTLYRARTRALRRTA